MMKVTRLGFDIAKRVFQVHGVDENGKVRVRKTLAREKVLEYFAQLPPCLIGMETCGGAHYWGRELTKLGHTVKLMAAQFVIPYRKRGKNDANDAEAICEAVGRPNMHFVAIKSEEQQSVLMVHRARTLVMANRTAQVNQIRGLLGEFGLVVPKGVSRLRRELPGILEDAENGLPALAREVLAGLLDQFREFDARVTAYDRQIRALAEASEPACVFHACRSMVSSHARPTFQLMSVRDFTACRSKTTRAAGSCPKVLSASMIVVAERC